MVVTEARPGRHPHVLETKTASACSRRKKQRSAVPRQAGRELAERRVHRRPEGLWGRPRIVHALARGYPDVGGPEPAGACRPEQYLSSIAADRGLVIGRGG